MSGRDLLTPSPEERRALVTRARRLARALRVRASELDTEANAVTAGDREAVDRLRELLEGAHTMWTVP
jgi:hypothetical protein